MPPTYLFVIIFLASLPYWSSADICTGPVCKYDMVIKWGRTMTYSDPVSGLAFNVQLQNGQYIIVANQFHGDQDPRIGTAVPEADVNIVDGYPRNIITINGKFLGETIEVMYGVEVVVKIRNDLDTEGVTIHWHGIHQRGTQGADGVPYVAQCPVSPGQVFEYRFQANPVGTHWYHSHFSSQRLDGLNGMLIVHAATPTMTNIPVMISDWAHVLGVVLETTNPYPVYQPGAGEFEVGDFTDESIYDVFYNRSYTETPNPTGAAEEDEPPPNPYGVNFDDMFAKATLVNGKGRYDTQPFPLTTFNVTSGSTYRFRFVHAGSSTFYMIRIDAHRMKLKAVDGCEVVPIDLDFFFIEPGERVDVEVTMDQPSSHYWFRVVKATLHAVFTTSDVAGAIINYEDSTTTGDPTPVAISCTQDSPCVAFNCPPTVYPASTYVTCKPINELRAVTDRPDLYQVPNGETLVEYYLNSGFHYGPSVNARSFVEPLATPNNQGSTVTFCDDAACSQGCTCTQILRVPFNRTVQIVLSNYDQIDIGSTISHHPWHLHGHVFAVLATGYGGMDYDTEALIQPNYNMWCSDEFCVNPTWRSTPPTLNYDHPPLKDTVIVPSHGYTVIRFRSDNEGYWLMHCHVATHGNRGMMLIVYTSKDNQLHLNRLPKCNYNYPSNPWTQNDETDGQDPD